MRIVTALLAILIGVSATASVSAEDPAAKQAFERRQAE